MFCLAFSQLRAALIALGTQGGGGGGAQGGGAPSTTVVLASNLNDKVIL